MTVFIIGTPCNTIAVPSNGALDPAGADPIADGGTLMIICDSSYPAVGGISSTCSGGTFSVDISTTTCGEFSIIISIF